MVPRKSFLKREEEKNEKNYKKKQSDTKISREKTKQNQD